jgi:addiction module RelE/StbE family toxin
MAVPKPSPREVKVKPKPGFKERYRGFLKLYPEIAGPMKEFNDLKRLIPPGRLPATMKDHKLDGRLDEVRECHLAPDVLLLYTHKDDVIELLDVCEHEDLHGKRGRVLASRVKASRQQK